MTDAPSLPRRMLASAGRTALTLGVVALAAGAVVAGQSVLAERSAAVPAPDPAPVTPVETAVLRVAQGYETERRFAGQFEPRQQTALAFEEGGTVAEVLVAEGDSVARGAVLARLDTGLLEAERDRLAASRSALEAQAELARRTNARQSELRERGFATDQTVDDTSLGLLRLEANIAEIDAALAAVEVRLAKAVIRAPFGGAIGERRLDEGAVASPGAPVVTLLEDGPVLFRAGIEPSLAEGLSPGDEAMVVGLSGARPARLERLAPELDAATRARIAFFAVEGAAPLSREGGEVVLTQGVAGSGAWVPLAALRQGPRGTWSLLTVEEGRAGIESAEIVHAAEGRAFVRGTFADGALYVPSGTHRIVPGEPVRAMGPAAPAEIPAQMETARWVR